MLTRKEPDQQPFAIRATSTTDYRPCRTCRHWPALRTRQYLEPQVCSGCYEDANKPNWEDLNADTR